MAPASFYVIIIIHENITYWQKVIFIFKIQKIAGISTDIKIKAKALTSIHAVSLLKRYSSSYCCWSPLKQIGQHFTTIHNRYCSLLAQWGKRKEWCQRNLQNVELVKVTCNKKLCSSLVRNVRVSYFDTACEMGASFSSRVGLAPFQVTKTTPEDEKKSHEGRRREREHFSQGSNITFCYKWLLRFRQFADFFGIPLFFSLIERGVSSISYELWWNVLTSIYVLTL
jgi:hypothetical protein